MNTIPRSHYNNRRAMALRLAEVLDRLPQTTARTVAALPAEGRRMVEAISGENRQASDETWAMVVTILAGWEARKADAIRRYVDNDSYVPTVAA